MVDRADIDYIKKMAKDVCHLDRNCDDCNMAYECKAMNFATRFYDAHYRKTEWISVEERLPKEFETVLVFCDTGVRKFQCVSEMIAPNGKRWSAVCGFHVTHWMPLPIPPKGDEGK